MTVIQCDICRKELTPRAADNYAWFAKGGVVVIVDNRPARLQYEGRDVQECCEECVVKTTARTWLKTKG